MARLDLVTIVPEKGIKAEVEWTEKDDRHGHTYKGIVTFADAPGKYKLTLVRGRFGSGFNIYPLTSYTKQELDASTNNPIPLPESLERFDGGVFTLDGAAGGQLHKQIHAIELLDELPEDYEGIGQRWTLRRNMNPAETRAVFGVLGYDLTDHVFEDKDEVMKRPRSG